MIKKLYIDIFKEILMFTVIPIIIVLGILYNISSNNYLSNLENTTKKDITYISRVVQDNINSANNSLSNTVDFITISDNSKLKDAVAGVFYKNKQFNEIVITDSGNRIIYGISKYDIIPKDKIYKSYGSIVYFKDNDLIKSGKIEKSDYNIIIYYNLSLRNLFHKLSSTIKDDYDFFITNNNGDFLFHKNYGLVLSGASLKGSTLFNLVSKSDKAPAYSLNSYIDPISKQEIASYTTISKLDGEPFYTGIEFSTNKSNLFFYNLKVEFGLMFIAYIGMIFIVAYLISRSISKPIEQLSEITSNWREGYFEFPDKNIPKNEIGTLFLNFKSVSEEIVSLLWDKDKQKREIEKLSKENFTQYLRMEKLFNSLSDGLYLINSDNAITMCNDAELYYLNEKRENIIGKKCHKLLFNNDNVCDFCIKHKHSSIDKIIKKELDFHQYGRKNDPRKYVEISIIPFGNNETVIYIHDITKLKTAIEQLEKKEKLMNKIINTSPDIIFIKDTEGNKTMVNKQYLEFIGMTLEQLQEKSEKDIYGEEQKNKFKICDEKVIHSKEKIDILEEVKKPNGELRYMQTVKMPLIDDNGEVSGILAFAKDITEFKYMQLSLEKEKEKLLITLKSIGDGVIVTDENANVILMNNVAETICGYTESEVKGKNLSQFFHLFDEITSAPIEIPAYSSLNDKKIYKLSPNTVLVTKSGDVKSIADSSAPIIINNNVVGSVLVFRDDTIKKKLDAELIKKQKLESIGVLAGGIAHDFNNILSAIYSYVEILKIEFIDSKNEIDSLDSITKLISRAKFLSNQLLTFSKGGLPIKKAADILSLLQETVQFVLSGSNIKYKFNHLDEVFSAEIDVNQISQVIHNLTINARQSINDGGEINISLQNIKINDNFQGLENGNYVKISISDTGCGIPKNILNNIFEPFFSTKESGSGLGLYIVNTIVKNHGGAITVESKIGEGTTFTLYFKASKYEMDPNIDQYNDIIFGTGKILIMDDEESIRDSLCALVTMLGYDAICAKDGKEALEQYISALKQNKPFDIVLMDLTIPGGVGGKEAVKELHNYDKNAKVVVMSGYTDSDILSRYKDFGFCAVLNKPFSINDINKILKEML